ncbi:NAD-dependent protein deacylase Cob2 [Anaerolineales bacterium]
MGISIPYGTPEVRRPETGLWEYVNLIQMESIYGFKQDPDAFYQWVRPLVETTLNARPNAAHFALVELAQLGKLKSIVTQNIDGLHQRAGNETVYELHGHMRTATCVHCFKKYDGLEVIARFMEDGKVPHCDNCKAVLKPNVILFGEQLPILALQAAKKEARRADVMIMAGSSLEVAPASELPILAHRSGAKLIIVNLEPTHLDSIASVVIHGDVAEVLPNLLRKLNERIPK